MQGSNDTEALERCVDCGQDIAAIAADRSYAVTDDEALCHACALRRGGSWDELHARWATAPRVDDLEDRLRPR